MSNTRLKKHNIDIMFLMILFLIFTFSAVSVLLMAVNSYRSVVNANEEGSNARAAMAYIKEVVRKNDDTGVIAISNIDGVNCLEIRQDGYSSYIYAYDGYLMELTAKDTAGATVDFGDKIIKVNSFDISWIDDYRTLLVEIEDASGNMHEVDISVKSGGVK